jgi:hypothetical protein
MAPSEKAGSRSPLVPGDRAAGRVLVSHNAVEYAVVASPVTRSVVVPLLP